MYASSINQLIRILSRLPGVGNKTAERFVFYLLKSGKGEVMGVMRALELLMQKIKSCDICLNFSDASPCVICSDGRRDKRIICVVAEPQDVEVLEATHAFHGLYHILRGTVDPDDEHTISRLPVEKLIERIQEHHVTEIILALNHDMRGETTALYLRKEVMKDTPNIIITRLARGLAMGSDIQYADEMTLGSALTHRFSME